MPTKVTVKKRITRKDGQAKATLKKKTSVQFTEEGIKVSTTKNNIPK